MSHNGLTVTLSYYTSIPENILKLMDDSVGGHGAYTAHDPANPKTPATYKVDCSPFVERSNLLMPPGAPAVVGTRIPFGLWNYYPDMGVFSPAGVYEDTRALALVNVSNLGFDKGQCALLGKALAQSLAGQGRNALVSSIEQIYMGIGERPVDVHPVVQVYTLARERDKALSNTKSDSNIPPNALQTWHELFQFLTLPFLFEMTGTDSDGNSINETLMFPPPAVAAAYEASVGGDGSISSGGDATSFLQGVTPKAVEVATDGSKASAAMVTAHCRANVADSSFKLKDAVIINAVEVIKGSSGTNVYMPYGEHLEPELKTTDLDAMLREFTDRGYMSDKLIRTIARKAQIVGKGFADPDDPAANYTAPLAAAIKATTKFVRDDLMLGQIAMPMLKYIDQMLKTLSLPIMQGTKADRQALLAAPGTLASRGDQDKEDSNA